MLRPLARTAAALLLSAAPARADAPSYEELRDCLRANVPERSSAVSLRLSSRDRGGREYPHEARLLWRNEGDGVSSTLVCLTEPRDVRNVAYLVRTEGGAQTLWVYLPEEGRALRINPRAAAARGRIARTAVGYRDLRYLPFNLAEARAGSIEETDVDGRPALRVALELPERATYARVDALLDRETCVPLRVESYGEGGELLKRIRADAASVATQGGVRLARAFTVDDRAHGVVTEVSVERVEVDGELSERLFSPTALERGQCPR